jgi:pimeloyl-ACP methyl ester carboxylesterase
MPTARFRSHDGVRIAYGVEGEASGSPVVLVHGFASSRALNWELPGWTALLVDAGRRVIALDCRGHGESEKPHAPEAYGRGAMARDVVALLDHLAIPAADVVGYSMGGRLAARLLAVHGARFGRGVLAGVGGALLDHDREARRAETIARALEAEDAAAIADPGARAFRAFADRYGGDRTALAACMRGQERGLAPAALSRIRAPVLVVVGRDDTLVGDPRRLADAIPGARLVVVEGRDHMSAVPARATKRAVLDFLAEAEAGAAGPSPGPRVGRES